MAEELLEQWRTEEDFDRRNELLEELRESNVFPEAFIDEWEEEGGLYPGLDDPNFVPKLMRKREYQELKQPSIKESLETGIDKCRLSEDFELSPVQRFVSRLLNPRTPYHSALLYHGVGVGKTCAAVTICESYLEMFPGRKAFVVAPPNIQDGFRRTIFDINSCTIPKDPKAKNIHRGCTGEIYLRLANCLYEKDKELIQNRVTRVINQRYQFFGYSSLYNYIREKTSHISPDLDDAETQKRVVYRRLFANRVLIIDEAHNLRDNPTESEEDTADDASIQDTSDAKAGKKLTPFLRQVLSSAEDITLVLMTATPMYNSYIEIIFLLNLLLLNDKRSELRIDDIFDRAKQEFTKDGRLLLGKIASTYVSFMRGENPLTFPLRLEPETSDRLIEWPSETPTGDVLTDDERDRCVRLPLVECFLTPDMEDAYKVLSDEIVNSREGLGITNMDTLVQAGNWIFPTEGSSDILYRIRQSGFDNVFSKEVKGKSVQFRSTIDEGAQWLLEDNLPAASGKCAVLLDRLNKTRGVAFVYSRFVASGALTIALALEANGYLPWGRDSGLLADGNQHPQGKQCALCPRHEKGHGEVPAEDGVPKHTFKQAKYVLLTGNKELSPNNADSITAARSMSNVNGEEVKVVIGSQVAGEGLDLRFIREIMVFDSWYHLNKLEQIVGRGIRNCSHAALPKEKRNCTVTLLVNSFASTPERETADMYSYRLALNKARSVGNVTRVLKEFALDCSLNRDAILVSGLDPLKVILDSQGKERRDVNINDVPLTPLCDWLDDCEYECYKGDGKELEREISLEDQDSSTYDEYTAQFQMNTIRKFLQDFISRNQAVISFEQIANNFTSIPRALLSSLLNEMVLQKDFTVRTERGEGRIVYRNGYYIFQPNLIQDTRIPIAIRLANIPISRDRYLPIVKEQEETKILEVDEDEDSEGLWEESLAWTEQMRNGTLQYSIKQAKTGIKQLEYSVPDSLKEEVNRLRASIGIDKVQKERLEVLVNLYDKIKTNEAFRHVFADVVLGYIWDEFLTYGTKKNLLLSKYEEKQMKDLNINSYFMYEGELYLRLLNTNTNKTEWFYKERGSEEMKKASTAIQEILEGEPDPILAKALNKTTTGFLYGFLHFNPKKKKIVFKKAEPPNVGGPAPRGEECMNVSNIRNPREQLKRCAAALKEAGMPTFQLDNDGVLLTIQNSVRICTAADIVLRCMDKLRVQGKRWFYKELEAKAYKHPLV